ncbi:MAG: hypothetical protein WC023_05810 [Rhodocyclaceae bacterium]
MTTSSAEQVSLDDVASDRRKFSDAHAYLKARAPLEWLMGGAVFSVGFGMVVWFLHPASPLAIYIGIVITSFFISGFAVYLNARQVATWYKSKEAELDSVESRIRAGENVPRPNPSINTDAAR